MNKTLIILGIFAFTASSYGQSKYIQSIHQSKPRPYNDDDYDYRESLKRERSIKTVDSLYNVWNDLENKEKFIEAVLVFDEFLILFDKLDSNDQNFDPKEMHNQYARFAYLLLDAGNKSLKKEEYGNAEKNYLESIKLYEQITQKNPGKYMGEYGRVLSETGRLYYILKDYEKAERYWLLARFAYESENMENDHTLLSYSIALGNLGLINFVTGRYDDAEKYYRQALPIRQQLADKNPEKYLSHLLDISEKFGYCYFMQKKYDEAKIHYQNTWSICNTLVMNANKKTDFNRIAGTYGALSWYHLLFGKIAESEQLARKALELDNSLSFAKVNLAHALLLQNHYREAKKLYEEIIPKHKQEIIDDLNALEHEGIIPDKRMSDVEKIRKLTQNTPTKRLSYPMLQKKREISNFFARR